ncbi:acetyl-CoA C-acetyltransferase [Candidatus Odyssella acanthamoebae]|uniref:Acetyl-CoA acetyltransferase n=1 Tax=Candidatus Odyssella acanthamoebae TaxID=91604 RepID=A0A077AZA9_9PROT|nr:acetyl-CoA C-acetyltransferase [Candidatus Paracaedibacter acanthamoebae]AIK96095.1 acetyl-CoA acetyltransferase [Candidatus Paracaedibacter acanthamoebae]
MKSDKNQVYVLGSARIPFAKSLTSYMDVSRQDLMVASVNALIDRYKLNGIQMGDAAFGAVMNSSSDFNLAREVILSTPLHPETPAYNVQRACGTGLETIWQLALKAHVGAINHGIAGGVDTNSDLPIEVSPGLQKILLQLNQAKTGGDRLKILTRLRLQDLSPKTPVIDEPRTKLSMGKHCELMVKEWNVSREEQDEFAMASHVNGVKAYQDGFYEDLVTPFYGLKQDGILRSDIALDKLAKLKPAFNPEGSLTAGNSSPLTDGSACVLIANDAGAMALGLKPLARIVDVQVAAVDFVHGAGLLMAPTKAVAQLLTRNTLTFSDFDYFEIHEAFAGQVLCTLKAWETDAYCRGSLGLTSALGSLDRTKLNTVGSSVALGHPFAATGARITGTLAKLLVQDGKKRGLISICTAGGMGIAAILESV